MIRILLPLILMFIPATAFADVGDLTPMIEQPGDMLVCGIFGTGREFKPASQASGLVHPEAALVEIKFHQRPDLKVMAARDAIDPGSKNPEQVIRIDFTGKGTFIDSPALIVKKVEEGDRLYYTFGPSLLEAKFEGRSVIVKASGTCLFQKPGNSYIQLQLGAAAEGECSINGRIRKVRVFDGDYNLMIRAMPKEYYADRKAFFRFHRDSVLVDTGHGNFSAPIKGFLGHPVWIEDAFFRIVVSKDGTKVEARKLDIEPGWVKTGTDSWQGWFLGREHVMILAGGREAVPVPPDSYQRTYYRIEHSGGSLFSRWLKEGSPDSRDVVAGETSEWNLGAPIIVKTTGTVKGREVAFQVEVMEETGLAVEGVTRAGGERALPPEMEVFDSAGRSVFKSRFERG